MDDNKKFGDVSQEDIDKAKKAAPDDLKGKTARECYGRGL